MTVSMIIIGILAFFLLGLCLFFWLIQPKKHRQLSISDLQNHFKRCCETLKNNGFITVFSNFTDGEVSVKRKDYKTKPDVLELRLTAGNHSRKILQRTQNRIIDHGYDIKVTHTKKKKLIQHLILRFQIKDLYTPIIIAKVFEHLIHAYKFRGEPEFKIVDYGPFIIKPHRDSIFYRIGYTFGNLISLLVKFLRKNKMLL